MGNNSLDRNISWEQSMMTDLKSNSNTILTQADAVSESLETIVGEVSSTYNSVPSDYKHQGLSTSISNSKGKMACEDFINTATSIETAVDSICQEAVAMDSTIAENVKTLKSDIAVLKARAYVIQCALDNPGYYSDASAFAYSIGEMKKNWESKTDELKAHLAEIEKTKFGTVPDNEYSEDPVNMATGNFIYDHADLKINGDVSLEFHRYYNSMDRTKGVLGRCFLHNYSINLEKEDNLIRICMQDGQRKIFDIDKEGHFRGFGDAKEVLTYEAGRYVMTALNGYKWIFDEAGKMLRQENKFGRGISFTYFEEGEEKDLLKRAKADNGSCLSYTYENGYLTKVSDNSGRTVCLAYKKNKLETVTTAKGSIYTYRYGASGRITEITNARNVTSVKNQYDEKHRVTHQDFPDGGSMHFDYDDDNKVVILTERNGAVIKYVHDSLYRNTDVIYADGTREHTEYNDRNQKVAVTDRNGNTTRMAYDDKGNLTMQINAKGEKATYTYNASNQLLTAKVNGKEKLKNSYDAKGNLVCIARADGGKTTNDYNEFGKLVSSTEAGNEVTKIFYDERQNIIRVTESSGANLLYLYDELNRVVETVDGNGNKTSFSYDEADKIVKSVNAKNDVRLFTYNAGGMLTEVVDYDGFKATAEYNEIGKISKIVDKEGNTTEYSYDKMWNIQQIVYANKGVVKNSYNKDNRLESVKLPEGGLVCYAYDANGNRTSVTDQEGNTTRFFYDELNRVVKKIDASGAESTVEYDEDGNVSREVNALGAYMEYKYNELGKCIEKKDSKGAVYTYEYDKSGRLVKTVFPNGSVILREYKFGRLVKLTRADGSFNLYEYDFNGNCISVTDSEGKVTSMEYDELNNLVKVVPPTGDSLSYVYDKMNNLIKVCDALGHMTSYTYTPNGKLAGVVDAAGEETKYEYDCMGNLTKVLRFEKKSGKVQETSYEWNLEGKVTKVTDALGNAETFAYDKCGRLMSKYDKDGYETKYGYDERGLMTSMEYADGTSVMLSFDSLRKLQEIKDKTGTTKIENDEYGRILSVTDGMGKTVEYEWGNMNERLATAYPDGKKAVYSYDEVGRLAGLETAKGMVSYSYDELGRLSSKKLPNEVVTEYLYNEIGKLSEISHKGADFTESYVYEYDAVGNKISADKHRAGSREDSGKYSYSYDELNRLTEVSKDGSILRKYGYDAFGNRSYKEDYKNSVSGIKTTYSYNENNQLIARVTDGIEESYSYDKRGNLVSVANGTDVIKSFVFDAANKMTESVGYFGNEEKKATYSYNGLGHRIGQNITVTNPEKDVMNELTKQISYTVDLTKQYHNLLEMEENDVVKDFYWDTNVVSMDEAGIESYYIQDDLGSPMALLNQGGNITDTYAFDEFGTNMFDEDVDEHEKSLQPFGYTGYQMDEASGLYFAQARRYDAWNGRFVSEDLHKGYKSATYTLNQYSYCWNRPMDYVDNNGKFPWLVIIAVVGTGLLLTGCSVEETTVSAESVELPMPTPTGYEFEHPEEEYNSDYYKERTNCYAFAFDIVRYPDREFYDIYSSEPYAAQPGVFSGTEISDNDWYNIFWGDNPDYEKLISAVTADAQAMGFNFIPQDEYDGNMTDGYWVLLVVGSKGDYHWYRQNPDGSWSHKMAWLDAENLGFIDPVEHAESIYYESPVGYFYVNKGDESDKE